jgi:hypothetical protein
MPKLLEDLETLPSSKVLEARELFSSKGWAQLTEELRLLQQTYLRKLAQASSYEHMLRLQGAVAILDNITEGGLEAEAMLRHLPEEPTQTQDYMRSDTDYGGHDA